MGIWWHALTFVTHERAKMSHKPVRNVTQAGPKCHTRAKMSHSHVISCHITLETIIQIALNSRRGICSWYHITQLWLHATNFTVSRTFGTWTRRLRTNASGYLVVVCHKVWREFGDTSCTKVGPYQDAILLAQPPPTTRRWLTTMGPPGKSTCTCTLKHVIDKCLYEDLLRDTFQHITSYQYYFG